MASLRSWARRTEASPSVPYEPTPYCDRLTLAEPFQDDRETRATAEDHRAERMRIVEATTSSLSARSRQ